jgi:hypothetical protein
MITIIPALDFIRGLCGTYRSEDSKAELRIWGCGYGVALDLRGEKRTEFVGVVGAFGEVIECYAQVGLPNVVRFVGGKESKEILHLAADDLPLTMDIYQTSGVLKISISLNGSEKVCHALHAV